MWHGRTIGAAALCALAGHAALYRSLWPGGSGHGYLGWYEAVLGAAVLVALAALAALVSVPALRRRVSAPPGRFAPIGVRARGLTGLAVAWLAGQEAVEHLVAVHGAVNVAPSAWLLAVAACLAAALVVAWAERGARAMLAAAAGAPQRRWARSAGVRPVTARTLRPRPLAVHRALRAPPALLV
jgi:hypothetical protein